MKLRDILKESYGGDIAYQMNSIEQFATRTQYGYEDAAGLSKTHNTGWLVSSSVFEIYLKSSPKIRNVAYSLGLLTTKLYSSAKLTDAARKQSPFTREEFSALVTKIERLMGGADTAPKYTHSKEELLRFVSNLDYETRKKLIDQRDKLK